jgi:uncharacterized membrane protein
MSSKVITFPKSPTPRGPADLKELTAAFVASFSTTSAAMLLEGIDDLARAVDKVAAIVEAMPLGEARAHAEADLETLRAQLAMARALSERIREQEPRL